MPEESETIAAPGRRTILRAWIAGALLAGGSAALYALESALDAVFDKPPAPLRRPLSTLPRQLGERYLAEQPDGLLDPAVAEALGATDYLMRIYRDRSRERHAPGAFVQLDLNYYASGSSTPHVPEVCWAASGRIEAPGSREVFQVAGVPGRPPLRVRRISFLPDAPSGLERAGWAAGAAETAGEGGAGGVTSVAYLFQVNGEYVASPQEVTSRFWQAANRFAYHAKIEITPMVLAGDPLGPAPGARTKEESGEDGGERYVPLTCPPAETQRIVADFLRAALPEIEACLPDPSILRASPPPLLPRGAEQRTPGAT
jgi:hypothetical protein